MKLLERCQQAKLTVELDGRNLRIAGEGLKTAAGRELVDELRRNKGDVVSYLTDKKRLDEILHCRPGGWLFEDEVAEAQTIAVKLGIDLGWKRAYLKPGEPLQWEDRKL